MGAPSVVALRALSNCLTNLCRFTLPDARDAKGFPGMAGFTQCANPGSSKQLGARFSFALTAEWVLVELLGLSCRLRGLKLRASQTGSVE